MNNPAAAFTCGGRATSRRSQSWKGKTITSIKPDGQTRSVLLVEGASDAIAIKTLAHRRGIDLSAEGVTVIEMGGATRIGMHLELYGPQGFGFRLAGLYDASEARIVERSLGRAGLSTPLEPADPESLGFYMCVKDLEDELIRVVGMDSIEQLTRAAGDLQSFRTFQRQPAWQDRPGDQQFHRFLGAGARRKIRYASLLVQAMDLTCTPRPLASVLDHILLRE